MRLYRALRGYSCGSRGVALSQDTCWCHAVSGFIAFRPNRVGECDTHCHNCSAHCHRQGRAPGGTEGAKLPGARPPSPRVTVASPRVVPPVGLVGDDGSPILALRAQLSLEWQNPAAKPRFFFRLRRALFLIWPAALLSPDPRGRDFLERGLHVRCPHDGVYV